MRNTPELVQPPSFLTKPATRHFLAMLWALSIAMGAVLGCGSPPESAPAKPKAAYDNAYYLQSLKKSVHKGLDCSQCHAARPDPAKPTLVELKCDQCHEAEFKAHLESVHGQSLARGEKGAAQCWDCHGSHDIVKVSDPTSRVYKRRLPKTCANCHQNPTLAREHNIGSPEAALQYMESIHGRALITDGLLVAPSCIECHGTGHNIQRNTDKRSPVHHDSVEKTCGKCHEGIQEAFQRSIHFKLRSAGDPRAPACIDCHSAHQISRPDLAAFKLLSDERCGKCHQDRLKHYRETYHGRAMALGNSNVAACFDCHGHHDILPPSDPASSLAPENKLNTCRKCHTQAPPNFANYQAHADHNDRQHYPIMYYAYRAMTGLLLSVFAFFGLHTLLWLVRSFALYRRDPVAFREAKVKSRKDTEGRVYTRFRPVDRFCHFLVIISFLLLASTGLPLKFYEAAWSRWIFDMMGGATVAAGLHRIGALITFLYFAIHIASVVNLVRRRAPDFRGENGRFSIKKLIGLFFGPDSPVPNFQDLRDFIAHQKWFLGRGPRPQFDRWAYWEKFDYMSVFWGVAIIGLSGIIMWIPTIVTRVLPGWVINIAHVVHSDEALLATGFIFTFHFFNVHFRIEKFPIDTVIFSGRITEDEMLHERKRQYDRLKAEGHLDRELVSDEWHNWKKIFTPIGMIAFIIGVGLVLGIYYVMIKRLLGH